MLRNISSNESSFIAVGRRKGGGLKFDKNDLSPAVQKIVAKMSLMGDKMYIYIFKFSLRFTECRYKIICLY